MNTNWPKNWDFGDYMNNKIIELNREIKELYELMSHGDSRDKALFIVLYCEKIKELRDYE